MYIILVTISLSEDMKFDFFCGIFMPILMKKECTKQSK